jgi:hypothetical protein
VHAARIVEIGFHERQHFGAVIVGIRLVGDTAIVGIGDAPAVIAARAGGERDRQQQDRRALCCYSQVQLSPSNPFFARLPQHMIRQSMPSGFTRSCERFGES